MFSIKLIFLKIKKYYQKNNQAKFNDIKNFNGFKNTNNKFKVCFIPQRPNWKISATPVYSIRNAFSHWYFPLQIVIQFTIQDHWNTWYAIWIKTALSRSWFQIKNEWKRTFRLQPIKIILLRSTLNSQVDLRIHCS